MPEPPSKAKTSRLSERTLKNLTTTLRPSYERANVKRGIVHLGVGAFHRAHQAVYTDDLLALGDHDWGITGVSLRSSSVQTALQPQDFLYSVQTLGDASAPIRIIGSVMTVLTVADKRALTRVIDQLANPDTQVVTLTVTEKGYCADHLGELDRLHPDIIHDLENPDLPRSAPGIMVCALQRRMLNDGGPITLLSCDNLLGNGKVLARVIGSMAALQHAGLEAWIEDSVTFPSSMVDRIVPQTSDTDLAVFEADAGYLDEALVRGESFSQWVIEDRFAGRRPAWDRTGAQFVDNVAPFEQAKLRLLNATHSALSYLGLLADYAYVHEALADASLQRFVNQLLDEEIIPEVSCPPGMDLTVYKNSILERFANSAVPYKTLQVASDGSLKLPQRIYPTIESRLNSNQSIARLGLVVAAWIQCLIEPLSVNDPAAPAVAVLAQQQPNARALVDAIAAETNYLGALAKREDFLESIGEVLMQLQENGSLGAAQRATTS